MTGNAATLSASGALWATMPNLSLTLSSTCDVPAAVGVPLICPLAGSIASPAGSPLACQA
jgi:hypothetical protein